MTLASQVTLLATRIGQEVKRHTPLVQASAPASPFVGQEWLDTTNPGVVPVGPWIAYTPTWTNYSGGANPAIGNGTIVGAYVRIGNTVHYRFKITIGSTTNVGAGSWAFGLPVPMHAVYTSTSDMGSQILVWDQTPGTWYPMTMVINVGQSVMRAYYQTSLSGGLGALAYNTPIIWATDDSITASGTYEAA